MLYFTFDVFLIGAVILFVYIMIDFIRNKTNDFLRRIVFYSFIVYIIFIAHFTIGNIVIPPITENTLYVQLVPFYFVKDLFNMYQLNGLDWFFWNSLKLSFFNLILLMPLGIYLSVFFKRKGKYKAFLTIFLSSVFIEVLQLILTYSGFILGRGFNVDDIIVNTLGGCIAFSISEFIKKYISGKNLYN